MRCGGLIAWLGELNSQLMSSGGQVSGAHKVSCTASKPLVACRKKKKMLEVFMGFLTILNLCPKPISWHQFFFDVLAEGFCNLEANWNSKQFSLQMLWGDPLQIMDVIYFWPCIFFFFFLEKRGVIKWLNICVLCWLTKQLASYTAMISYYYESTAVISPV